MKMPNSGRKKWRQLSDLLADTPELAVVNDTFEQRVQRHKERMKQQLPYSITNVTGRQIRNYQVFGR